MDSRVLRRGPWERRSRRRPARRASGCRPAPRRSTRIATTRRTTRPPASSAGTSPSVPETWRFSIEVATAWERALDARRHAAHAQGHAALGHDDESRSRRRSSTRCSRWSGAGSAAASGDGRQYVSWIHEVDFVRAVSWLIEHETVAGAVNLAAPNPLPNRTSCARSARRGASARPARRAMDARARRDLHADRVGAGAEEPPRRAGRS